MSDPIDRQLAIVTACSGLVRRMEDGDWRRIADIRENLIALPSAKQWIPCSERLPEEKEASYWICTDGGYQCQVRWTEDAGFGKHGNWRWHHMDYPQYSKVIAWMPLPEPYMGRTFKLDLR